ncbi:MAG: hypothetical protein MUF24_06735 [Chitinophagaceae bacterium]|nr:hypothetical protein [Chitinophagaceae bacterium]
MQLTIKDNGTGMDMALWNKKSGSFGKQLIGSLCNQLRAKQLVNIDNGTEFTLIIPVKAA